MKEFVLTPKKLLIKYSAFFVIIFLLQTVLSYIFIYQILLNQTKSSLESLSERIKHDISFNNDKWNMDLYNDDPYTPNPNGASGFSQPLYIITKQGLIIERNQPIHGLFDTSDYKHLLNFLSPQTITSDTQERWRVSSRTINAKGRTLGVIFVAYYNPISSQEDLIDNKLQENLNRIASQINIQDEVMDTSKIDIRNIRYDVSFEVVNTFNKVLVNNGRIPSFIDPSYVDAELRNNNLRTVTDIKTNTQYLVFSQPLIDQENTIQGIVTVARPIDLINQTLNTFMLYSMLTLLFLTGPIGFILLKNILMDLKKNQKEFSQEMISLLHLSFNRQESIITHDKKKTKIPYSSNQYYLCDAIFTQPKKRWEQDELLERFGETNITEWRKVYDAMIALNKKLGFKLVIYENRTYRLNPLFLKSLH